MSDSSSPVEAPRMTPAHLAAHEREIGYEEKDDPRPAAPLTERPPRGMICADGVWRARRAIEAVSTNCYLHIDTGGEYPATVADIGNMTNNVAGMWSKALGFPLDEMEGWTGAKCIPALERALSEINYPNNRAAYTAMAPSNGWGDREGAASYLQQILDACREHPKATLHISQ